jgi:hypothetical protein
VRPSSLGSALACSGLQATGLARIEQTEDVRVLKLGGEADLPEEPFAAQDGGEVGAEYLDRDRAVMLEVPGQPDRGHATLPDLAIEQVAVMERFAKLTGGVGHEAI